jgi:hypothetical protein
MTLVEWHVGLHPAPSRHASKCLLSSRSRVRAAVEVQCRQCRYISIFETMTTCWAKASRRHLGGRGVITAVGMPFLPWPLEFGPVRGMTGRFRGNIGGFAFRGAAACPSAGSRELHTLAMQQFFRVSGRQFTLVDHRDEASVGSESGVPMRPHIHLILEHRG